MPISDSLVRFLFVFDSLYIYSFSLFRLRLQLEHELCGDGMFVRVFMQFRNSLQISTLHTSVWFYFYHLIFTTSTFCARDFQCDQDH